MLPQYYVSEFLLSNRTQQQYIALLTSFPGEGALQELQLKISYSTISHLLITHMGVLNLHKSNNNAS